MDKKGSGVVSPSTHGYKIGQEVFATVTGGSTNSSLKHERPMREGEKGIITGVSGYYTEILLTKDNKFVTRCENRKGKFLEVYENIDEDISLKTLGCGIISSSSFGYNIGDRVQATVRGHCTSSKLKFDENYIMEFGDEGIVTGIDGDQVQILCGANLVVREEYKKGSYLKIISKKENLETSLYSIY